MNYDPALWGVVSAVLTLFLGLVLIVFTAEFLRRQKKFNREKELLQAHFDQALLQTRLEIQEETFKKISQEIHDNIGQMLTLVKLNLNTAEVESNSKTSEKIKEANGLLTQAIQDLRDISKTMNADIISKIGISKAISMELEVIEKASGISTRFVDDNSPDQLNEQVELILFRIVQEALHNSIKHAKAKCIDVVLSGQGALQVVVKDDGIGFDPKNANAMGSGLTNIESRCKLINAQLTIDSLPGKGTTIIILLKKQGDPKEP